MRTLSGHIPVKSRIRYKTALISGLSATVLGVAAVAILPAGQALAACVPPTGLACDSGTTTANVDVTGAIVLSNLTPAFTLSGAPGDSPFEIGAVHMDVFTNNTTGYNVTVEPETDLSGTGSNTDTIPAADLSVRETTTGTYAPLDLTAPTLVFTKDTRSIATPGDALSNDYEFNTPIPDVTSDTYSATLDYIATTNGLAP
jgi:large repetitive protein